MQNYNILECNDIMLTPFEWYDAHFTLQSLWQEKGRKLKEVVRSHVSTFFNISIFACRV